MASKTYDMLVSLGGSCAAASQLKWRGLRQMSFPFDSLYCETPVTLKHLADLFETDFKNWPIREQLVEMGEGEKRPEAAPFQYHDKVTGFRFIHDFRFPVTDDNAYSDFSDKYRRRLHRLFECLKKADRICLLFDSNYSGCEQGLRRLREVLLKKYGASKTIDVVWVEFESDHFGEENEDSFRRFRFVHPKTDYNYKRKSFEFAFLDEMELSGKIALPAGHEKRFQCARTPYGVRVDLFRSVRHLFQMEMSFLGRRLSLFIGAPYQ